VKITGSAGSSKAAWIDSPLSGASASPETLSFPRSAELKIEQPLFDGGRAQGALTMAKAETAKAQAVVASTEHAILLEAVKAYVHVLKDQRLVALYRTYVQLTAEHHGSVRMRSSLGEATATDVAQTEAALAEAQSLLLEMEANLDSSRALYHKVIGTAPAALEDVKNSARNLPTTEDDALKKGLTHHPDIQVAKQALQVAYGKEVMARSDFAPSVMVSASLVHRRALNSSQDVQSFGMVSGHLVVPIYDGGLASARTQQVREEISQARFALQAASDEIRASIISAWVHYEALSKKQLTENMRVNANKRAFQGTEEEERAGQRTLLDTLNARRELLKAQSGLMVVETQKTIAAYGLLAAVGELSIDRLY
jgi:outer membrane protein